MEKLLLGLDGGYPMNIFELGGFQKDMQVWGVSAPAQGSTCTLKHAE